ncbi:MAG: acyl-CoA dehydrogenase family protein [Hyphomonas sp.]
MKIQLDNPSPEQIETTVEAWLDQNWDSVAKCEKGKSEYDKTTWLARVRDSGFAVPTWSEEWYGLGLKPAQARIIERAFKKRAAPGTGQDRFHLGAVTVYRLASKALKEELLPGLLSGQSNCLLYSEPGAGSDLAGVRTRAERDGDDYIINGQKVWTSNAAESTFGMLLTRTDWDAPKHKGISFFIFPMKQAGVEIKPINQITGESEFNEVFITNGRVPARYLIGELNEGWKVLQTALAYERLIMGEGAAQGKRRKVRTARPELVDFAARHGALDNPHLRQQLAQALAYRQLNGLNMKRAKTEIIANGSSSLMSLGKLAMSRIQHGEAKLMAEMLGSKSLLDGGEHPDAEMMNFNAAKAYMNSIGGGTDQIQRNIISERILGLPRETEIDRNIAFKDVKNS